MLPQQTIDKINKLYSSDDTLEITGKIEQLLEKYAKRLPSDVSPCLTERDIILITYADNLRPSQGSPLQGLIHFCRNHLKDIISMVHILPFFPYSSDDGFSVMNYRQVNSQSGHWSDIDDLGQHVDLCFDLVLNHASAQGTYFQSYLAGLREYRDFFIEPNENFDTSKVVRPRTGPLLHSYQSNLSQKKCWTTFSEDQVDLNFANPNVFLEMLDVLLFYVSHGARMIRLDAIAYLWKQSGTSCVHLPQTHTVVQLIRDLLDLIAPHTLLLSETNFPHHDNISYFGNGHNEAQMVYNFPMPPLVLHTITTGNAHHLTKWAATIKPISDKTTFLNFTASHDGIGVRPAADIISENEFQALIDLTINNGGRVSCKADSNGQSIPYELNINYFDALNPPDTDQPTALNRFLLSQSIALVFLGTPAIYIHSLIGSRNWTDAPDLTSQPRSINREKIQLNILTQQLQKPDSLRAKVFTQYSHMITLRRRQKAFNPQARQCVFDLGDNFFALARISTDQKQTIIAIHNVTDQKQNLTINPHKIPSLQSISPCQKITDLITGTEFTSSDTNTWHLSLQPYQFVWLNV